MAKASNRPMSPHLQIWRWGPAMLLSILHRVTGSGMATFGLGLLLWWLGALASGADAYAVFQSWVWADLSSLVWSGSDFIRSATRVVLKLLVIGLSWALFQHILSGLRHFVLDIGAGYELDTNNRTSAILPVLSLLVTAGFWALIILR